MQISDWTADLPARRPDSLSKADSTGRLSRTDPNAVSSPQRAWLWGAGGEEYLLRDHGTHIGRALDNDVTLSNPDVSRHHAVVRYEDGAWWLLPEPTRNGTYRNDRVVTPGERVKLDDGDRVDFGPVVLVLRIPPARVAMQFSTHARTSPGQRRENQDAHVATRSILAVADGVGGRPAGATAARIAVRVCATAAPTAELDEIVAAAETAIRDDADADPARRGMSATLDVARLRPVDDVWWLEGMHVGDGYVFIQDDTGVHALTTPDTVGQQLRRRDPQLAEALAPESPRSFDDLVSALGFANDAEPQDWAVPATAGQRLLMVSDGLVNAIGRDRILSELLTNRAQPLAAVTELLLGLAENPQDNVTIVIAEVEAEQSDYLQLASPPEVAAAHLYRSGREPK